jgi:protein-S-isoprenylcysteine O-methyltransferase Ste14
MPTREALARIERFVWIFIYVGLFLLVTGLAALQFSAVTAWTLIVGGSVLVVAGVVLIWVRSRYNESTISNSNTQGKNE